MNTSFSLGLASGMTSLAIGVPLLASMAGAQTASTATESATGIPTVECIAAMQDMQQYHLEHFDERSLERKAALQDRLNALQEIADMTDGEQRAEALKELHEEMKEHRPEEDEDVQELREQIQAECGRLFGGHGAKGHGPMKERLAEKLGLTEEEFQAALDAGKTIPELAEEQGVELPEHPARSERGRMKGKPFGFFGHHGDAEGED